MSQTVYIKLTQTGPTSGPFDIYDQSGNIIATGVSRRELIDGVAYTVDDGVTAIRMASTGICKYERIVILNDGGDHGSSKNTIINTGCVWRHLDTIGLYNSYYGNTQPYVIEYPFHASPQDDILQSFKDYTNVYQYVDSYPATFSTATFVELDDVYFNKMIVYNNQQCSGLLKLDPKPRRNLKEYMSYPKYNSDSRTIVFAKSDSFYQINGIYDVMTSKSVQMFVPSCESMSIDKVLNQSNMTYSPRSFMKAPLRAKDSKIRLILDDRGDVHMVSRFVLNMNQISYK